jgi:hypothetical protein
LVLEQANHVMTVRNVCINEVWNDVKKKFVRFPMTVLRNRGQAASSS